MKHDFLKRMLRSAGSIDQALINLNFRVTVSATVLRLPLAIATNGQPKTIPRKCFSRSQTTVSPYSTLFTTGCPVMRSPRKKIAIAPSTSDINPALARYQNHQKLVATVSGIVLSDRQLHSCIDEYFENLNGFPHATSKGQPSSKSSIARMFC